SASSSPDPLRNLCKAAPLRMLQRGHAIAVWQALRTCVDKEADDLKIDQAAIAEDHRLQQRSPAEIVDVIDVHAGREKDTHRLGMPVMGRGDQRGAAISVGIVELRPARSQDRAQDLVSALRARIEK